jgi:hypothetical protein
MLKVAMEKSMVICFAPCPYNKKRYTYGYGGIEMGKMRGSANLIVLVMLLTMGWTLNSVYHVIQSPKKQPSDAHLIYQIALLQLEMLNNKLANSPINTEDLTLLKQAAYAVDYTFERFLISLGTGKANELLALKRMTDYILRLQMGGNRPLRTEEIQTLSDSAILFKQLYDEFTLLMSSENNGIISSHNTKVHKFDQEIVELFSRKLLQ